MSYQPGTTQCKKCKRERNTSLYFYPSKKVCKDCLSEAGSRQVQAEKDQQLTDTITAHYSLYA